MSNNTDGSFYCTIYDGSTASSSTITVDNSTTTSSGTHISIGNSGSGTITYPQSTTYPTVVGTSVTVPATGYWSTSSIGEIRYGTPSYTDLVAGLKPGTEFFERGTTLKLRHALYMTVKGKSSDQIFERGSTFVYLGVLEDYDNAKEHHLFFSSQGIVQYSYWIYDLGWRVSIRESFQEIQHAQSEPKSSSA